jgi:hypothetical protein
MEVSSHKLSCSGCNFKIASWDILKFVMSHHKPPVLQQNPFIIALTHHLSTLQISHQPGEMGRLKAPITLTISVFDFDPNNNNG